MRLFAVFLAFSCGNIATSPLAAQSGAPALPETAAVFLDESGKPRPGDYRWLRDLFSQASPEEQETAKAIMQFNTDCWKYSQTRMVEKFAAMGIEFDPGNEIFVMPDVCYQFPTLSLDPMQKDWDVFVTALDRVRPHVIGILRGIEFTERQVLDQGNLSEQLRTRTIGEQALRTALVEGMRKKGITSDIPFSK